MSKKENTIQVNALIDRAKSIFKDNYNCTFEIPLLIYGILDTKCLTKCILNEKYKFWKSDMRQFIESVDNSGYSLNKINQVTSNIDDIVKESKKYVKNNVKAYTTNDLSIYIFDLLKKGNSIYYDDYENLKEFLQKYGIDIDELLKDIAANLCNVRIDCCESKMYSEEINYKNVDYYIKLKSINETTKNKEYYEGLSNFEKYAENMTKSYENNQIDPIVGREKEISRLITILSKRIKNNPIILGEPGIGKTALVEGLVQRIQSGNVPINLKNKVIFNLNLSSLIAGTKYRGDLEERINSFLDYIVDNKELIIFIDEIHTIIGSGKTETSSSIADILKPYLSRGRITIIGATTLNEYKATIEKDGAMERRFQPLILTEPTKEETFNIISGIKSNYEKYHNIKITDNIIRYIIEMSTKYITDRNLPDKAIDLLDESCVWSKINRPRSENLSEIAIRNVISVWKGINVAEISNNEFKKRKVIEQKIKNKIIGQNEVIDRVIKVLNISTLGFESDNKPLASFLFLGSTGVGKTFLAKTIAEELYDENSLIRLDMSEYMEKNSVNKIIGSPPGYVGFDSTNGLTEKVRRNQQSVVLFDEIDKAHPDVINILLQILDEGYITDSYGRKINFKQTIIILTANISSYIEHKNSVGFTPSNISDNQKDILNAVKKRIKSEILDRLDDILIFRELSCEDFKFIISKEISTLKNKLKNKCYNIKFDESVYNNLNDMCQKLKGARQVKIIVKNEIYNFIMDNILNGEIQINKKYTIIYSIENQKYELVFSNVLNKTEIYV